MNALQYAGSVKDGKLHLYNRKGFDSDLRSYEGERVTITMQRYQKDKSSEQRGYYRGVVVPEILEGLVDMGYHRYQLSLKIVHDMLKEKFLWIEIANEHGEFIKITKSTEDLPMPEYALYIQSCIDWALEFLNIIITPPQKQGIINFKQK